MNKYLKISEYIWLATALVSIGVVTYVFITAGFAGNYYLLILPVMSGAMWFMRRIQRSKMQKKNPGSN